MDISLEKIKEVEKENFIKNIQIAFKKAYTDEFGEFDGEIIPRQDILNSFNRKGAEIFNIVHENKIVGGIVVKIDNETNHNDLELFFVNVECHSKGIGYSAWKKIEKMYPNTKIWETCTPYFDKRNIHFYVNKCGFKIVEFFNPRNPEPNKNQVPDPNGEYLFRFEKIMN